MPQGFQTVSHVRQSRGKLSCMSGQMAEEAVIRCYLDAGCQLLSHRWRGRAGEIDLIMRDGDEVVFVEVKKSATHAMAAQRLQARQMNRICLAAQEYADSSAAGSLTPMRFDAALVDGAGRVELIPNAFGVR